MKLIVPGEQQQTLTELSEPLPLNADGVQPKASPDAVALRTAMASTICDLVRAVSRMRHGAERQGAMTAIQAMQDTLNALPDGIDGPQGTTVVKLNENCGGTGAYMAAKGHRFVREDG